MYEKPDVTRYGGKELLDLMGPVETQYAQTTCEIVGTVTDPIQYVHGDTGNGEPRGYFELSIPETRITTEECPGFDGNIENLFVNFENGVTCDQTPFPYQMDDGLLVVDGNAQTVTGDTCQGMSGSFPVTVELEYPVVGAGLTTCLLCQEDNLAVELQNED